MLLPEEKLINSLRFCKVDPTPEILERYDTFARMMIEFNTNINITRITDPEEIIIKHIEDSLSLYRFLRIKSGARYLDIGTGGGVPALPLLIARPDLNATLIDSVGKKLRFADSIIEKFGLSAETVHIRAEELAKKDEYKGKFDLITARAVTKLDRLAGYAAPLLAENGVFAAYKGDISDEEYNGGKAAVKKLKMKDPEKIQYVLSDNTGRTLVIVKK